MWEFTVDTPTLVLGSTQPDTVVDPGRARSGGWEIRRRRSGGGVVVLVPGGSMWVDVVITDHDPEWDDDLGRSFLWLGHVWQRALAALGLDADVVAERRPPPPWAELVCFAGRGFGEVLVDGAKVVGLSQRRTRGMARFQCQAWLAGDHTVLADVLRLDDDERDRARVDLRGVAQPLGVQADRLRTAFLASLPAR